jgi:hypothetical protein
VVSLGEDRRPLLDRLSASLFIEEALEISLRAVQSAVQGTLSGATV